MDSSLLTTCRQTGILKTVDNASDFRICKVCGGPTHKSVGDVRRTTYDLTLDNKVHSETVDIPADDLLRKTAFRCSYCSEPFVNLSDLQDEVVIVQALHDVAVEGTDPGEYAVGSKATLQTAITVDVNLIAADASTQAQIDTALLVLKAASSTFIAGKVA